MGISWTRQDDSRTNYKIFKLKMTILSPKQQKFSEEYLKDLNATQAAIRAGYSEHTAQEQGSRLLSNVMVKEVIVKAQQKLSKRAELSQEWVMDGLKKVFERCMQQEAMTDREGNFEGLFKFEHSGANKALELIGKHLGMFVDKKEYSGSLTLRHEDALSELE